MTNRKDTSFYMRIFHRYLGFFLAGIMAMYALSGVVLVFRKTDTFKKDVLVEKTIASNLTGEQLGVALNIKNFKADRLEGDIVHFKNGSYNTVTGEAEITKKELPYIMDKMTHLHKATTNDPLYFLNLFFGVSLFFFVVSSFWMFRPSTSVFRKGIYFTLAGIVLTLVLLFV